VGDPARLELLGELAPHPYAEDDSAGREDVQRGHRLGRHRRVAEGQEVDAGAQADPARHRGHVGQDGQGVERGRVEADVVANPDGIVAEGLDPLRAGPERVRSAASELDAEADVGR